MRFKVTLQLCPEIKGREIPINYQYELSSVIYHILAKGDSQYSKWLHENGFEYENKRFKLFTFSRLIAPYGIDKERQRLILKSNIVEWYITFSPERSTKEFILGVFNQQQFEIADSISGASFRVREIQIMPSMNLTSETVFETMSPVCISQRNEKGYADYLSPEHPNYTKAILTGLLARYEVLFHRKYEGETYCKLELLNQPKSCLIAVKAGTSSATKVRGYLYRFRIELPLELLQIAYECGLGEKGSIGFGMIKTI